MARRARGTLRIESRRVGIQPRGRWKKLAVAPFAWTAAGTAALTLGVPYSDIVTVVTMVGALGWMGVFLDNVVRGMAQSGPGQVSVETDAIEFTTERGTRRVPLDDIRDGFIARSSDGPEVVFKLRGGNRLHVLVADEDAAWRLLDVVGVADRRKLLDVRLASRVEQTMGVAAARSSASMLVLLIGMATAMFPMIGLAALAALTVFGLYPMLRATVPPRAVVGTDGLAIKGIGRNDFIPYAEIASVRMELPGVVLKLRDGGEMLLPMHGPEFVFPDATSRQAVAQRTALFERLSHEVALTQGTDAGAERHRVLDRSGRSIEQWRVDVSKLIAPSNGYRDNALTRDEALRILADGGANTERRIAAALALSQTADDEMRERVRVVVNNCASDEVRVALDKASRGQIDDKDYDRAVHSSARLDAAEVMREPAPAPAAPTAPGTPEDPPLHG